ncbi:MAG: hypothetical protein IKK94_05045 [Clostridia bacterium]|nr:hypothetical protein [Clostridia bacterium]
MKKLLMALLALTLSLSSCGFIIVSDGNGKQPEITTAPDTVDAPIPGDHQDESTADTSGTENISEPEKASDRAKKRVDALQNGDFSGQSFIIATTSKMTFAPEAESYYDMALLLRDSMVEEKYNIEIISVFADDRLIEQELVNSSLAEDYYADLVSVPEYRVGGLAARGVIMNLRNLPFYGTVESYSDNSSAAYAGNAIYADIGAASTDFSKIYAVFFNRSIAEGLGHDIDRMVKDNEWTWESFDKISRMANEKLGIIGQGSYAMGDEYTDVVFRSANISLVDNTLGKDPTISFDSVRLEVAIEQACALIYGNPAAYKPAPSAEKNDIYKLFGEGKILFAVAPLSAVSELASCNLDWGIAPIPKMNEEQDRYYAYTEASASVLAVPSENNKLDVTGLIIGALNTASYELLSEEYKTHCLYNYFPNIKAMSLMDEILQSITFDFTYLYSSGADLLASATHGAVREARKSTSDYATDLINARKEAADAQLGELFGEISFPEEEYPVPPETEELPETEDVPDTETEQEIETETEEAESTESETN